MLGTTFDMQKLMLVFATLLSAIAYAGQKQSLAARQTHWSYMQVQDCWDAYTLDILGNSVLSEAQARSLAGAICKNDNIRRIFKENRKLVHPELFYEDQRQEHKIDSHKALLLSIAGAKPDSKRGTLQAIRSAIHPWNAGLNVFDLNKIAGRGGSHLATRTTIFDLDGQQHIFGLNLDTFLEDQKAEVLAGRLDERLKMIELFEWLKIIKDHNQLSTVIVFTKHNKEYYRAINDHETYLFLDQFSHVNFSACERRLN